MRNKTGVLIKYISNTDDVNMLGENLQTIRENTEIYIKASKDIGLEVNDKTKYRWVGF